MIVSINAAPLYEKRRDVIAGRKEAPDNETEEGKKSLEESKQSGDDVPAGVPDFWLTALRNHPAFEELITDKDAEVLSYLEDITSEDLFDEDGDEEGFVVAFHFRDNPFFNNKALSVTYYEVQENGFVQVRDIVGSDIHWKEGKNVTVKKMKKKPKPGSKKMPETKLEPVNSFFRFFSPPEVPDMDEVEEDEDSEVEAIRDEVENHMEIGEVLREHIIKRAIAWFTGEALVEMEDEDEDDEFDEVRFATGGGHGCVVSVRMDVRIKSAVCFCMYTLGFVFA